MTAEWEVIEDKRHSEFGASQAWKRINCAGSMRMERNFPNETSEYAAEGTKAHGLFETMLKAAQADDWQRFGQNRAIQRSYFFNRHQGEGLIKATEMMDAVEESVQYVRQLIKEKAGAKVLLFKIEHAFDMSFLRPDLFGTCDLIIVIEYYDIQDPDDGIRDAQATVEMHMLDFKYGAGVVVGAMENDQLAMYSLGGHYDLKLLYDINQVTFHILQPRVKNFDSWTTSVEWLTGKYQNRLVTAYDRAHEPDAPLNAGPWCADGFCRARGNCPEIVRKAIEVTKEFGNAPLVREVWSSDALAMEMIGVVRAWAKAREEQIKRKILNGEKTDATQFFKVVQGRSSRNWKDEEKLAKKYPFKEHPLLWHEPSLKSVAQIEKACKDDDLLGQYSFEDEFAALVVKTPGSPTITRIEDSRVAIDRTDQARNEFALEDMREKPHPPNDPLVDLLG